MTEPPPAARRRPFLSRLLAGLVRFLASSALATTLICLFAVVLAWATWVEGKYGTPAVQAAVYQSTWFAVLLAALGVNVLLAAVVRFPWQRKQIGFLIVHSGILVLLLGCWVSREKGVEASLTLLEGETASKAVANESQFVLAVKRIEPAGKADKEPEDSAAGPPGADKPSVEIVEIPFRPGPFSWSDYRDLPRFPWAWARRDRGVLYDRDGVRLEVLDYLNDSRRATVPELTLSRPEQTVLTVREIRTPHMPDRALVVGSHAPLAAMTTFQMATSQAETDAFRDSRPEEPLGPLGQIVLHAAGKKYALPVDRLRGKGPTPLGDSGYRVELVKFDPDSLLLILEVHAPSDEKPSGQVLLSAPRPELNQQDRTNGVFGVYWFAPAEQPARAEKQAGDKDEDNTLPVVNEEKARAAAARRVDILQGHDKRLYYRTWGDGRVGQIGELPADGSSVVAFADTDSPVEYAVESFLPADKPGVRDVGVPFDPEKKMTRERVRVRLTVDGQSREFWLTMLAADDPREQFGGARSERRMAMVRVERPRIDLGFAVRLRDFDRQLDPGTSRASHYLSHVDFLSDDPKARPLEEDVVVELNRPAPFADPVSGRVYRFFQTGFDGPYAPEQVGRLAGPRRDEDRSGVYRSHFTVAYDPGRHLKYAGCLMIIAGIAVMYYMKAYFFGRIGHRRAAPAGGS